MQRWNTVQRAKLSTPPAPVSRLRTCRPEITSCAILSNILNVSFGRAKDYAIITVTNKATGEIVHSKTYHNTSIVMIDMSSCEKGEYTIHIILNDCLLEGTFTVQ